MRNGLKGPEDGRPIVIGDDCWFGGNVVVLPGVVVGDGVVVGAGAVVTKVGFSMLCCAVFSSFPWRGGGC